MAATKKTRSVSRTSTEAQAKHKVKQLALYASRLEALVVNIEHAPNCNYRLGFLCSCHYDGVQAAMAAAKKELTNEDT